MALPANQCRIRAQIFHPPSCFCINICSLCLNTFATFKHCSLFSSSLIFSSDSQRLFLKCLNEVTWISSMERFEMLQCHAQTKTVLRWLVFLCGGDEEELFPGHHCSCCMWWVRSCHMKGKLLWICKKGVWLLNVWSISDYLNEDQN